MLGGGGHKDVSLTLSLFYLTLCDLTDCSLSGSSVHGIFQARILEWVLFLTQGDL